jgi:hypothetical protein
MTAFLDGLARALAKPMPRSRALRLMGGAVVTAAVPSWFPKLASARALDGCNASGGGCIKTARCCFGSDGFAVSCCPWYFTCRPGSGLCGEKYICEDGRPFCGSPKSKICCGPSQVCVKGECFTPCRPDEHVCHPQGQPDGVCCPRTTECVRLRIGGRSTETCIPKCPGGRTRCGPACCPRNWHCKNPDTGVCKRCASGHEECGKKCCNKRTSYCGDPTRSLCCPNNASACPTGPVTAPRRTCCPKPNRCARQLPAEMGALTAASPYVCCPPDRTVPGATPMCCAPGQVSLGGRVVVGFGIQGFCCKRDQLCGSGPNQTCCQRFSETIGTDLNQTCCSGRCVTLNYDPNNCGSCGRRCPPGQRCARGVCTA